MRLLVRMTLPFDCFEGSETFETIVRRVRRAEDDPACEVVVLADIDLPPKYQPFANARRFNPDGTYRVEAYVKHNRRTLADFIASGETEVIVEA
ncbi:hypothetical protein [Paraburkholderia sp. 22B1P]|uniref:hypothetical protein n=1 Tax=Paraburkholderia sp. 22B1P TaxID=3080498 RepID=UPI0030915302|nr:hypothetical protein PBP221_17250 [Paraburkholderia sp. 22B1P]